jgi:hypothetical protein
MDMEEVTEGAMEDEWDTEDLWEVGIMVVVVVLEDEEGLGEDVECRLSW